MRPSRWFTLRESEVRAVSRPTASGTGPTKELKEKSLRKFACERPAHAQKLRGARTGFGATSGRRGSSPQEFHRGGLWRGRVKRAASGWRGRRGACRSAGWPPASCARREGGHGVSSHKLALSRRKPGQTHSASNPVKAPRPAGMLPLKPLNWKDLGACKREQVSEKRWARSAHNEAPRFVCCCLVAHGAQQGQVSDGLRQRPRERVCGECAVREGACEKSSTP